MIGTPASLTVRVSRKLGDKDFGSYGVEAEITVNLPADAKLNEAFDAADSWLTAAVARSMADKTEEIQKARPKSEEPEAETKQEKPKAETKEGGEESFACAKFTLAKRPDKKFRLELYGKYGDSPSRWPIVKYTADRDRMWEMLHDVADDYDFSDMPVEYECDWLVHYAIGKEFVIAEGEHKGEKSHYKDLLGIVAM